jgi:hypothetical protein
MKKMNLTVTRIAAIAALVLGLVIAFTGQFVNADERAVGTVEKTAEFRAEALAEKAVKATYEAPVVEATVEEVETIETAFVAPAAVVEEAKAVEAETVEVKEEVVEEVNASVSEEIVEEYEMDMEAEIANTAEAATVNTTTEIVEAATTAASADGIEIQFEETETKVEEVKSTVNANDTTAKYLGVAGGTKKAITLIGDSTFRDVNKLQAAIDANNIVCYPNNDMTKGVKYFAGHNPGAMSHIAGLKVGAVVRLSNDNGYQDYRIMEIKTGTGSFASVKFNTTNGTMDAWTMLTRGTENAVIIQYCVNGVNTLHYGVAI